MKTRSCALVLAALFLAASVSSFAQADGGGGRGTTSANAPAGTSTDGPAEATINKLPWEWGPFFQGGKGVGERSDYTLLSAGVRLGKVITDEHLGGIFRGQFEYAGELMPYWQAFTPAPHDQLVTYTIDGVQYSYLTPYGGGSFTGVSLTPIILRWDFKPHGRLAPFFQGAGGLIYTTHKFPPDQLVAHGTPGGTSVWNFSPQGGAGFQYFLSPRRSIMFSANAIHISSASLGDKNPGVNASVQFQVGYTWWTR
ncbi:MAG TPA: acyloxyacyl hydrolase [Acidobacteriaceae bacterium]|nr:acyloxyacyl hydrolase [Acidobacteriaceae bacterium]